MTRAKSPIQGKADQNFPPFHSYIARKASTPSISDASELFDWTFSALLLEYYIAAASSTPVYNARLSRFAPRHSIPPIITFHPALHRTIGLLQVPLGTHGDWPLLEVKVHWIQGDFPDTLERGSSSLPVRRCITYIAGLSKLPCT